MTVTPVELLGIALGLGVLLLIVAALFRGELRDIEKPKYEMLGLTPPPPPSPAERERGRVPGRLGIEDRVIRLGLVGAAFYYGGARLGFGHPLGVALGVLGGYLLLTGLVGRDPLYYALGWDTRFPEQGR